MDESLLLHGHSARYKPLNGPSTTSCHGYAYATDSPVRLCSSQEFSERSTCQHMTSHKQQARSHSSKESGYSSNRPSYHESQAYYSQQELVTSHSVRQSAAGGSANIPPPHPSESLVNGAAISLLCACSRTCASL